MSKRYLSTEQKKEYFKTYGGSETNTGSSHAQVALLTARVNHLSGHLKSNPKDHSTRVSLLKMVGQRKRLLQFIAAHDILEYRKLIEKLGIRK